MSAQAMAMTMADAREWAAACDVQRSFMRRLAPAVRPIDYSAGCRQMHELGGDCYDFMPLSDSRMALTIGDASGKGLPAALMISSVQSALRAAALFAAGNLSAMLEAVSHQVHATSPESHYTTLFYGVLDERGRKLRYVNAGHIPPMLLRRDGSIEWLKAGGAPLGMFSDWCYEEGSVELGRGDLIVACTDGVIEAENPRGEPWGLEGLRRAVSDNRGRCVDEMVNAIFRGMEAHSLGNQADDATVMAVRVR